MKPLLESPRSELRYASLAAFERRESSFAWNWHYHPEFELTYIHQGHGTRLVADHSEPYRSGDLVLLGSNLPHTWFTRPTSHPGRLHRHQAVVLQFQPRMFPEALLVLPEYVPVRRLLERASRGLRFPNAVGRKIGMRMKGLLRQKGVRRWLEVADILSDLAATLSVILASASYHHERSYRLSLRIERVTTYLGKHYGENVPLAQMAALCGLSPCAFSRFFRKMTHQTFVDYRNSRRIHEVCRLLAETDLSITEIAYQCGFGNLANFNRRFLREKKMVPRNYRRLYNPEEHLIGRSG